METGESSETPFRLSAKPPPRPRTVAGRKERESPLYHQANIAYDLCEAIARSIRKQRPLTAFRLSQLGANSLSECLLYWRADFRRLMTSYHVGTFRELFRHYGRNEPRWQFHHVESPRRLDFRDARQKRRCLHFSNLRPITAAENLRLMTHEIRKEKRPLPSEVNALQLSLFHSSNPLRKP